VTVSTTRTYRHTPDGHGRTQVWFIETTIHETGLYLGTADDIDGTLAIEDAHKARTQEKHQ